MKKLCCLFTLFLLVSTGFITIDLTSGENLDVVSKIMSNEQYENGYRYNVQGWVYVHVEGDPYERGYQYGYLLANEILDMVNRWSNIIHNHPKIGKISKILSNKNFNKISDRWWDFCRTQINKKYWDKFPEEYKQEIRGIVDGVNAKPNKFIDKTVDYKDILAINQMYEFMSKLENWKMGLHTLRIFFHQLQKVVPPTSSISTDEFLAGFLTDTPTTHCNGFIATGDATTDGQMIFSHSTICHDKGAWWWVYYIAIRWNIILDIQPTFGNRFIISTSPGLIWSDEDYYQNDNGIVFLETTVPQGYFDNIGLPLSVRARNAIQYGNTIDDVIYHLRYKNDGSMNAVWLIGDDKTGEIARFELGYSNYAVKRTFNGFYWSANNPENQKVRNERFVFDKTYLLNLADWILNKNRVFSYYGFRYIAGARDLRYEEFGNENYGKIDVDSVKELMSTKPIVGAITDIKLTNSKLLEQNGLWALFGNPIKNLNYTTFDTNRREKESVNNTGWARIFGSPTKVDFELKRQINEFGDEAYVLWETDTKNNVNDFYSSGVTKDDMLYTTASDGKIYAIHTEDGYVYWEKFIGEKPTKPAIGNDLLFIGYSGGLKVLDLNGRMIWEKELPNLIISDPVVVDNTVIFGNDIGNVYALSVVYDTKEWSFSFDDEVHISSEHDDNIYITSGKNCYAINLKDEAVVWEFNTEGMITSPPVLKDDKVFVNSWDNNAYAIDAKNGKKLWYFETGWGIDTSPAVYDDMVFVGSADNNLYALNIDDGKLEWMFTCNASIHSTPVVYGDFVFFGSDDGRFYALNRTTGESVWFFAPGQTIVDLKSYITTPIISDAIVHNGTVFLGSGGTIYALDAQTVEQPASTAKESDNIVPEGTWLFIVLSLLFLILITALYLGLSKKRIK